MPVTPQMLRYILGAGDMTKLRTKAVVTSIIFAFAFLLRVSEYAAETANVIGPHIIRRHHVVFKRGGFVVNDPRQADEIEITIPSSKTDQAGQGYVRNHFKTDQDLCVVRLMADWFAATPNADKYDPVFSFQNSDNNGLWLDCVTRSRVDKVLKAAAHDLGYEKGAISTHSLRRGACTALIHAGVDESVARIAGRWSSDVFRVYTSFTAGLMDGVAKLMFNANVTAPTGAVIMNPQAAALPAA